MAAIYNKRFYKKDIVIEIYFSDSTETYQLWLTSEKCIVKSDNFKVYTTRIETTSQVWQDISNSKTNGAKAMMDGLLIIQGDFNTMNEMNSLFSTKQEVLCNKKTDKKSNMIVLLMPFIIFWLATSVSAFTGGIIAGTLAIISLFLLYKFKFTIYDYISILLIVILSAISIASSKAEFLLPFSYIIFGLLWGISCVTKIPLTAYYSINDYDYDYFENPLFIKTNRLITIGWTLSYIICGLLISYTSGMFLRMCITSLFLGLMGVLTKWFVGFYPQYIARKK